MSATGMGVGGGALMLGGSILDYIGQSQGARAMQAESNRQVAEQTAALAEQRRLLDSYLSGVDPAAELSAGSTANFIRSDAALSPAIAAAGKRLGVSGAATGSALAAARRRVRPAAFDAARAQGSARDGFRQGQLGINTGAVARGAAENAQLYDGRLAVAGLKGQGLRAAGSGISQAGTMMLMHAMQQPAGGEAALDGRDYTQRPGWSQMDDGSWVRTNPGGSGRITVR